MIAARANELIRGNIEASGGGVREGRAVVGDYDLLGTYVDDLPQVLDLDDDPRRWDPHRCRPRWVASVAYRGEIADRNRLDLPAVNPLSTRRGAS